MSRQTILRKGHRSWYFLGVTAGNSKSFQALAYPEPESGLSHLGVWVADGTRVPGMLGNAFTEIYHLGSTHLEKDKEKNVLKGLGGRIKFNLIHVAYPPILFLAPQKKRGCTNRSLFQEPTS